MNNETKQDYVEIIELLNEARGLFSDIEAGEGGFSHEQFEQYLKLNELDSAIDELERISLHNEVPREFWQLLIKSANRMQLKSKIKEFTRMLSFYP